jgi:hypothetical protein
MKGARKRNVLLQSISLAAFTLALVFKTATEVCWSSYICKSDSAEAKSD